IPAFLVGAHCFFDLGGVETAAWLLLATGYEQSRRQNGERKSGKRHSGACWKVQHQLIPCRFRREAPRLLPSREPRRSVPATPQSSRTGPPVHPPKRPPSPHRRRRPRRWFEAWFL